MQKLIIEELKSYDDFDIYLSKEDKEDFDKAYKVIKERPELFSHFSKKIRHSRDVVLEAVKINGDILSRVADIFRNDKEVVLNAIRSQPHSIVYADLSIRDDNQVMLEVFEKDTAMVSVASYRIRKLCKDKNPYIALLTHIREQEAEQLRIQLSNNSVEKRKIHKI